MNSYDYQLDTYWITWTANHPKSAAIFWPAVRDLVSMDMYTSLPDLFEIAMLHPDVQQLKPRVVTFVQSSVLSRCRLLSSEGKLETAAEDAKTALTYGPNESLQTFLDPSS